MPDKDAHKYYDSIKTDESEIISLMKTSELKGYDILASDGSHLGKLNDIIMDYEQAKIAYAVLATGGGLTLNKKLVTIPFEALSIDPVNHAFTLNIDKDLLDEAPGFEMSDYPDLTDRSWADRTYQHFGMTPYWM